MNTNDPIQFPPLDDILVVGWLDDAEQWHGIFSPLQIISSNTADRLTGVRFRRAYFLDGALSTPRADKFFEQLRRCAQMSGRSKGLERIQPIGHYDEVAEGYEFDLTRERAERTSGDVLDRLGLDLVGANV